MISSYHLHTTFISLHVIAAYLATLLKHSFVYLGREVSSLPDPRTHGHTGSGPVTIQ